MKNKIIPLLGIMIVIALSGAIIASLIEQKNGDNVQDEHAITVAASFYAPYIIGLNLADDEGIIRIESLTASDEGCLHDYQLTANDMKLLSQADILLMNGGGMEAYLTEVTDNFPDLVIVDLSRGITMLDSMVHEGEPNPHVWLDPRLYTVQVANARDGIIAYINTLTNLSEELRSELEDKVYENAEIYISKVEAIDEELDNLIESLKENEKEDEAASKTIIFHEAFAYIAQRAGLEVAKTIELEDETALSAGVIADAVDLVKQEDIGTLFTEKQYGDDIAKRIEEETDAKVYIIDSAVTGEKNADAYIRAMEENIITLKEALKVR